MISRFKIEKHKKLFFVRTCFFTLPLYGCSISVDKTILDFGSSATTMQLNVTAHGPIQWSFFWEEEWLTVNPDKGSASALVIVGVDRTGLADGEYEATLEIESIPMIATPKVTIKMSVNRELCKAECQEEFDRCMIPCQDEEYPCDPVYRDNCVFGYQYCIIECEL
jgi:hypothetical protein